jgi:hypothetical protein
MAEIRQINSNEHTTNDELGIVLEMSTYMYQ